MAAAKAWLMRGVELSGMHACHHRGTDQESTRSTRERRAGIRECCRLRATSPASCKLKLMGNLTIVIPSVAKVRMKNTWQQCCSRKSAMNLGNADRSMWRLRELIMETVYAKSGVSVRS